ncbi:MAG: rhodanese-related sulfurtransferase [Patescibacteria group bacterium]
MGVNPKKSAKPLLFNKTNKDELKKKLEKDATKRTTLSFYRYVKIENPETLRNELYLQWSALGVMGRIYLAHEGINAQLSVPTSNFETFKKELYAKEKFTDVPFKIGVEDDGKSFYKLIIKVKEKIVADGLDDSTFDPANTGTHLNAEEFNKEMAKPETIVVDMRNHYESEVGRFENAVCPDADTFREELQMVKSLLKGKEERQILLYCTGGIRCEKASAYLKHQGFKKTFQLQGGIINYAHEVKEKKLESKFKGKNFVFDERVGERITDDVISQCHQCGKTSDEHNNCKNDACHLLFIQCEECAEKYDGCCTTKCQEFIKLPIEEQRKLRRQDKRTDNLAVYKSRLRPKLKEILT